MDQLEAGKSVSIKTTLWFKITPGFFKEINPKIIYSNGEGSEV
jgi:hypothetical protein